MTKIMQKKSKLFYRQMVNRWPIIISYIIHVMVIIVAFGLIYEINGFLKVASSAETGVGATFGDAVYFSGISFFTLGHSNFVLSSYQIGYIAILEGVLGVIINGIFIGTLIYSFQLKTNTIVLSDKLMITKSRQDEFLLGVGIKHDGALLVSIDRSIDIGFEFNNRFNSVEYYYDSRHYLKHKSSLFINSTKHGEFFHIIRKAMKKNDEIIIRVFVKGVDSNKQDIHRVLKEYTIEDIVFVSNFEHIDYNKTPKSILRKRKSIQYFKYISYSDEAAVREEFVERKFFLE